MCLEVLLFPWMIDVAGHSEHLPLAADASQTLPKAWARTILVPWSRMGREMENLHEQHRRTWVEASLRSHSRTHSC